jgi:uncharacterized membrane protein
VTARTSEASGSPRTAWLVVLAGVGLAIAMYLTAFQVGLVGHVWDPLFGTGSERVLTSAISRLLPLPDASLGAGVYLVDAVLAIAILIGVGPRRRVRQALAVVATLGALAGLGLVVLQPLVAHAFCSLCLASAAISIALAIGAIAEVTTTSQEVQR